VRVRKGAFGPGLPRRDVLLSPDHAVHVDGVLIPVRYLVNGASIAVAPRRHVTYRHVELPTHDVVLAEGLPAESYLDTGNRAAFENGGTTVMLHADFARGVWEAEACATLVLDGEPVEAVRRRLVARLPELGHDITADPGLRLLAGDTALKPRRDGAWLTLAMPADATVLRLVSRWAVPMELDPTTTDTRRLGVCVQAVKFDGVAVKLDDARLAAGWQAAEPGLRWTDGEGAIDVAGVGVVELCLARSVLRYHVRTDRRQRRTA
jgi:hypothetical protein